MRSRQPTVLTGFPAIAKPIVPSDSLRLTDYDGRAVGQTVYVGQAGTVACVPVGNDPANVVEFYCPTGGLVPVEVSMVKFSGTTASQLIGLF